MFRAMKTASGLGPISVGHPGLGRLRGRDASLHAVEDAMAPPGLRPYHVRHRSGKRFRRKGET